MRPREGLGPDSTRTRRGVLALWLKLDDKLIATLIAAVVLFTMGRVALGFIRA